MSDAQNQEDQTGQESPEGKKVKKPGEGLVGKTLFDRYEVLEVLGESAMALVLKAKEVNSGRMVAIKTVTPHEPEVVQRFAQEVQLHSKLKHKNIVEAIDCLEATSGRTFFIMEYLFGTSLMKVLQNQKKITNETELAAILIQICHALEHAHNFGVLHRDLKPGNIFLMESEGTMAVKVLDFGIAKPLGQQTGLTQAGYAVGSPLYMSPEQCRGQAVDARSDVYSLGILTYEMATGELPYPGHNLMTVMAAHCDPQKKPAPLSRSVPELRRVDALNEVIQTAMETDPQKRFQTIAEYRKAIEKWYQSIQTESLVSAQGPLSPDTSDARDVPENGGSPHAGAPPPVMPDSKDIRLADEDEGASQIIAREERQQMQSDVSDQRSQLRTRLSVARSDDGQSKKSNTIVLVVVVAIAALAIALLMMGGLLLNK